MTKRCLVVDDDAGVRRSLARLLRQLGYEVVDAASGEEAMGLLERGPFEVVLLDFRMPGLDGASTWSRIRERLGEEHPMGILVSASVEGAAIAAKHGMRWLAKPFGLDELRGVLEAPPASGEP